MENISEKDVQSRLNEYVSYRKNGICQIVDICTQNFGGQGKKTYYVLRSVYDGNMKVFVPQGSELEKEMKKVLTVPEIHSYIDDAENVEDMWIDDCKARVSLFEKLISSGDITKILWMIKAISLYKSEVEDQKKKMKANDLKYLALAENLISGEFAFSLGIPKNEVLSYIKNYISKK